MNTMSRGRLVLAAALVTALAPGQLWSQYRTPQLIPGDYVRLYGAALGEVRAEGVVERVDSGRIIIAPNGGRQAISRSVQWNDLAAVRRPVPAPRRMLRGGFWGAFLGGSAGGIASPFIPAEDDDGSIDAASIAIGVAAGALVGGGIGAVVGFIIPQHDWDFVRMQPSPMTRP